MSGTKHLAAFVFCSMVITVTMTLGSIVYADVSSRAALGGMLFVLGGVYGVTLFELRRDYRYERRAIARRDAERAQELSAMRDDAQSHARPRTGSM